jgi:hypothetical protein
LNGLFFILLTQFDQDSILYEAKEASARVWRSTDGNALCKHINDLTQSQLEGAGLDLDVSCPTPDGNALLIIAADISNGCANHRTLLLRPGGPTTLFWTHSAPLAPACCIQHSLSVPDSFPLKITALASSIAPVTPSPPAVLCSFDSSRSNAQQRFFYQVLCHVLAAEGQVLHIARFCSYMTSCCCRYAVVSLDSSHWRSHQPTQMLVTVSVHHCGY